MTASGFAAAQDGGVECATLPNPVYVPGTTLAKPFFARIAPKLGAIPDGGNMTLVYQGKGSCQAKDHVTDAVPVSGTALYWEASLTDGGAEKSCNLPAGGATADMAMGDVSIFTCTNQPNPAGIGDFSSFVEPFGFIVPPNSTQTAITAEEAYFIMKFGGQAGFQVPPWTDPNLIVIRNQGSSTQLTIGMHIGVLGTMWSNALVNTNTGGGAVLTKVAAENTTGNAEKTLGILACDTYDPARNQVKMLAFQSFKQRCIGGAVYPDSTATSFDKRNVRDGHYPIWSTFWTYTRIGANGQPTNARVRQLVEFFANRAPLGTADAIADVAKTGNVPLCAMNVSRPADGAPIVPYSPPEPCGCYFDSLVGTTSCTPCPSGTCSGTQVCRHGYCEAK